MIKEVDWKTYGRFLSTYDDTTCAICGETIRKDERGITYTKARSGSHLFMHVACVKNMEARNDK